jgi:TonB family protein
MAHALPGNAAGAATSANLVRSSGKRAFDDSLLPAVRRATYSLSEMRCAPAPVEYVWTTTFERRVLP